MASTNGRNFILEMIDKYQQNPCLWQVSNKDYHNKLKRNRALDEMLPLFRTKDPDASRETVQKKLSSIRGSYNKELRKVKASLTSVTDPESVHVPKLWYFDHLSFLLDQDCPGRSRAVPSVMDDNPLDEEESDDSRGSIQHPSSSVPTRNFKRTQPEADQILQKIAKRMEQPTFPTHFVQKPKVPHGAFGEYVAEKLRSLPASMVPHCQKIINDAIFFAEMQTLNITSRIVTEPVDISSTNNHDPVLTAISADDSKTPCKKSPKKS